MNIIDRGPVTLAERKAAVRRRRAIRALINLGWILFVLGLVWMMVGFNPPEPWSFQR